MEWPGSVSLRGDRVLLRQLTREDAAPLIGAASDGELWNSRVTVIPDPTSVAQYVGNALAGQASGTVMSFAITVREDGRTVGSTRFWRMDLRNRSLEIGHTWIGATWQRTFVNTEAKYLMLRYAFDVLGCIRVQLETDVRNERSQAAILRLGATREGVLRNERIMPDGRKRDTVLFSVIDDDWPEIRRKLELKLAGHTAFAVEPSLLATESPLPGSLPERAPDGPDEPERCLADRSTAMTSAK